MSPDRTGSDPGKDLPVGPSSADTQPPGTPFPVERLKARTGTLRLHVHPSRPGVPDRVEMSGNELVIGREEGDIQIDDLLVSRRHAIIERVDGGELAVRDLDSTNGTFLNGALLLGPAKLQDGDDIRIGPSHLRVRIGSD